MVGRTGGAVGVRDLGALQAALAQPRQTFAGRELYADVAEKAAALCYAIVRNHPFVDGNKRAGHAAMETFLVLNGFELSASIDESEEAVLRLAASKMSRVELAGWVSEHLTRLGGA